MIVNPHHTGWEIIFQRHHALLATKIASQVKPEFHPKNWIETLVAIAEHDDGQRDWDEGTYVDEDGHPIDFTQFEYDLRHARQAVKEASYKSAWMWLTVSRHVTNLYSDVTNPSAELQEFLEQERKAQNELLRHLELSNEDFEESYAFMRWCDECSLAICKNKDTATPGEINGKSYEVRRSDEHFIVEPWPFTSPKVELRIEHFILNQRIFESTDELFKALHGFPSYREITLTPVDI